VPDHEFLFALDVSDEAHFDRMLSELTGSVLTYVGYPPAAVEEIRGALHGALKAGLSNGHQRCDVRFRAQSGELLITVAYAGGAEWRTARALP
jgi:hypothetical protein